MSVRWRSMLVPAAVLVWGFALAACKPTPADVRSSAAPTPVRTAVGPTPGIQETTTFVDNPFGGDRAAAGQGQRLFVQFNCSGCHGDHGGGGMGPSLRDQDWLYGNADAQIFSSIAEGRANGMPAWGPKLAPDQIWRVVTYLKTMRTTNEPDPPEQS
jgi:cytochrome c oxidase cbb3-type subunit 3